MSSKKTSVESYIGKNTWRAYFYITKPGIIAGNLMAALGGFLLASWGNVHLLTLITTLFGMAFSIACACVLNNYLDRDIDVKMERTLKRTSIINTIPLNSALLFAIILGVIGVGILSIFTNFYVILVSGFGFIFYIIIYTLTKRSTYLGVHAGAVSGAMPLVVGYLAARNGFDIGAVLLFLIMFLWQIPHFYAISIFRNDDYKKAGIPSLSVVKGIKTTQKHILFHILLFMVATSLLTVFEISGYIYLVLILTIGTMWFVRALININSKDTTKWARTVFGFSLLTLVVFSILISLNSMLP
jgi:protoheme IX farnesyltransferase